MDTQKLLIEIEVDSSQAVQRLVEQKAALEKLNYNINTGKSVLTLIKI